MQERTQIEIVAVEDLQPDPINPRERITERAAALDMSLSKFGHVLPIVADVEGTIVSGHQRHTSLLNLGATICPVIRVPLPMDEIHRGARLMLFNLASADIGDRVHHDPSADEEKFAEVMGRLAMRGEIDLDDPSNWPCMNTENRSLKDLLEANPQIKLGADSKADGTITLARYPYKVKLPILVNKDGKVVFGNQRFAAAVMTNAESWPVVTVKDDPLLADTLNVIAMGYAAAPMKDVMRASVWLGPSWRRKILGRGFIFYTDPVSKTFEFDFAKRKDEWIARHGTYIADIGAGGFGEASILNGAGIRSVAFEPFALPMGGDRPDLEFTRKMARVFLEEIALGKPFDSVFASAVLNQVPFEEDRFRVISLLHALCGPKTKAFFSCLGTQGAGCKAFMSGMPTPTKGLSDVRVGGFEPYTQITSLGQGRVMVQKWHSKEELLHLAHQLFNEVHIGESATSYFVSASKPKPMKAGNVRKAVEHEFDLPWPDGQRFGLVDEAKAAFSKRLGMKL